MSSADAAAKTEKKVVVFYDGGCRVCNRTADYYRNRDVDNRTEWIDSSKASDRLAGDGIKREKAAKRIYAVTEKGEVLHSLGAFRAIWDVIPGYRFLYVISSIPVISGIMSLAYGIFARHRHLFRPL